MLYCAFFVLALGIVAAGCGSSSSTTTTDDTTTTTTPTLAGLDSCSAVSGSSVFCGTAFAADGQTPLAGATVTAVADSGTSLTLKDVNPRNTGKLEANASACLTDGNGTFACSAGDTSGSITVQISGGGYTYTFTVTLTVSETAAVTAADSTAPAAALSNKFVVITGAFDSIEDVLMRVYTCGTADSAGDLTIGTECSNMELVDGGSRFAGDETNPNTVITSALELSAGTYPTTEQFLETFLANATNRAQFDAIFFNCGMGTSAAASATAIANLQAYVTEGGAIYASDWASQFVEAPWPEKIIWNGSTESAGLSSTAETSSNARDGSSNDAQPVNVQFADLSTWLVAEELITSGASTFDVNFNLGVWVVMTGVASDVTTYLDANSLENDSDITAAVADPGRLPISVGFSSGDGCVFYGSYHNEPTSVADEDAVQERVLDYLIVNKIKDCT